MPGPSETLDLRLPVTPQPVKELNLVRVLIDARPVAKRGKHPDRRPFQRIQPNIRYRWVIAVENGFEIPDLVDHLRPQPGRQGILAEIETFPLGSDPIFQLFRIGKSCRFYLVI